jgi:hypothetical protein
MTSVHVAPDPAPRRRGRPRAKESTASVSTRLPASEHDRLITIARAHRMPVAHLVRQLLIVVLGPRREG